MNGREIRDSKRNIHNHCRAEDTPSVMNPSSSSHQPPHYSGSYRDAACQCSAVPDDDVDPGQGSPRRLHGTGTHLQQQQQRSHHEPQPQRNSHPEVGHPSQGNPQIPYPHLAARCQTFPVPHAFSLQGIGLGALSNLFMSHGVMHPTGVVFPESFYRHDLYVPSTPQPGLQNPGGETLQTAGRNQHHHRHQQQQSDGDDDSINLADVEDIKQAWNARFNARDPVEWKAKQLRTREWVTGAGMYHNKPPMPAWLHSPGAPAGHVLRPGKMYVPQEWAAVARGKMYHNGCGSESLVRLPAEGAATGRPSKRRRVSDMGLDSCGGRMWTYPRSS